MRATAQAWSASALCAAILALPRGASAASFDPEGSLVVDPAASAFEDFEEEIVPEGSLTSITVEDAGALSGARVLELGAYQGVDIGVSLPARAVRYRVSTWIRGGETIADVEIRYADNPHSGVDEIAVLYPTGRMTSDGWVELSNDHVRIDGTRGAEVAVGFFSPSGAAADAIEIVPVADLSLEELSGAACEGAGDPVCGEDQVCRFSQCRYLGGSVPDLPAERDEVAAYLAARLELLFGPLLNRELDLPNSRLALDRMRTAESPWAYWNAFTLAIRRLHDGHTTTSSLADFVLRSEKPVAVCFIEGDADLSHDEAPADPMYLDVLVSHTGPHRNLGLGRGDRLVAVDGQHPTAWARAQTEHHWGMSPTSNRSTFAETAEQLRSLVARYAHTITVVRCDTLTQTCDELETIDLSAVPSFVDGEPYEEIQCDNRPLRHLATSPASHQPAGGDTVYFGLANESDDVERVYAAEWDSLYSTTGSDFAAAGLKSAITQFKADARGVIFDHRTGNGGTILGPKPIWDFTVPKRPISLYFDRQHGEAESLSTSEGLELFASANDSYVDYAGTTAPTTTMPVALLLTRDVSASDWLPLGLKGGADNVKIFAPYQTNGGFSTRYMFGYWLGVSYVIAVGDTLDVTGLSRNGRGVEPDFVVVPLQSDLIAAKDTVFEAALAWIREELAQ
ncbi:MAG: hypothetical protein IPG04_37180 [Polyangiaceae bacterium]|jgi:hypothetical protein|nr:hypothetical protein [Polyangiaceae bacterium]